MALDKNQMAAIGKLKDLTISTSPDSDPFLYYLPRFLEYKVLESQSFDSYISFTQNVMIPQRSPLVQDGLLVLNQLVDPEDGSFIPPNPVMFENNSHFKWGELGSFTDTKSAILHIVNKVVLVLNLGKK